MKFEIPKKSPFRRVTMLSTLTLLTVVACATFSHSAYAKETVTTIEGDAAEFFWNSIKGKIKLKSWKSNSTTAFEKFDFATYVKQQDNVTCERRVDLNNPDVNSYSCKIIEEN